MRIRNKLMLGGLLALVSLAANADLPGKHPYYLHALSDLRAARWMLEHRPGDAAVSGREDEGIYLADVERSFADASADGTPGAELFYEHVHLTFAGNYRLAHTVLEQIVRILPDGKLYVHTGVGNLGTYSYASTALRSRSSLAVRRS